ncbi:alpha/beta fold hydrolase [Sideroxydans sp. CL21]|uniref:alpha/beta hydrolase n=1 Tax=Sideroxydans sp. CL21 TaxID=2600596 RepID=UPI0024BC2F86|nr:alpha/beta fold hydrolase [Sideroxydans sp. CL21]
MMEILGLRHRASGVNSCFSGAGLPFADYVRDTQAMLRQHHDGKNDQEAIVAGNTPFELLPAGDFEKGRDKPYRRGVLLTHGLSDSPYHMRHLGAFFQRNGFRVMAVLLPGHGTRPGDLLEVDWREWVRTVAYGADCLAAEVDELYLAGFSAGAALSLFHAGHDNRVRGLFLFSPAFEITPLAKWANLHKLYSWLRPKAAWVGNMQDRDLYKYESFCKNAAAQMYKLTQALPKSGVDIPVFAVASADDATVNSAATLRFIQQARHVCSKLVWYSTAKIEQENIEWVDSAVPEKRILGSAHTAIVMSPEDAYYGANGEYANCLHYYDNDSERYKACMSQPREVWWGEVSEQNLEHGLLRRLMYNPHYAAMETSMLKFIQGLP